LGNDLAITLALSNVEAGLCSPSITIAGIVNPARSGRKSQAPSDVVVASLTMK